MGIKAEIMGPIVVFFMLFFPIVLGVAAPLLALYYRGPLGWGVMLVIVVDYAVPLCQRAWPRYNRLFVAPLAQAFREYSPGNCLKVDPALEIDEGRKYLFCAHPHGVFGFYVVTVMEHLWSEGRYLTCFGAPILIQLPLARRHFSWVGAMAADAKSMRTMKEDAAAHPHNVFWSTPGGIEEAFNGSHPDYEQIIVEKRKGFCKIALQCGTDLVPVYGFGNNQFMPVISPKQSVLANASKFLNVSLLAWVGRGNIPFSCVPVKHPQLVAVGKPIRVEQCSTPSQEQINDLHRQYGAALKELFDKHKIDPALEKTGFGTRRLIFENEKP